MTCMYERQGCNQFRYYSQCGYVFTIGKYKALGNSRNCQI